MKKQLIEFTGRMLARVSPTLASRYWYWGLFKQPLHLKHPVTLNEKLMWLKLNTYRDDPLVTQCADKFRVRAYLEEKNCGPILNDLYGVWDSAEEIDWDSLPDSFVLKCNHGCGYNILCPDKSKLNIEETKALLNRWMREDFWLKHAEIQYRDIPKKIICEAYLGDGAVITDYKVYCFHGEPSHILVCVEREAGNPRFYFFDPEWNLCALTKDGKKAAPGFKVERPSHLTELLEYAKILSEPFPYVRADFYHVKDRIVFGELTFTPAGALDTNRILEADLIFGRLLRLSLDNSDYESNL